MPDIPGFRDSLQSLADRLTQRGTRLSFGAYHQAVKGCSWYTHKDRQNIRHDWPEVAARYLRRFLPGTVWHRGGHHVALIRHGDITYHYGPAIVEVRSKREDGPTMLRDGDRRVRLALDRLPDGASESLRVTSGAIGSQPSIDTPSDAPTTAMSHA